MKTAVILIFVLAIAGCASRVPAPVDERRGAAATAPRPPATQAVPAPPPAARRGEYVVKRGDTLYSIALEQGVDYRELARWNRIDDPSKLRVGQPLRVISPEAQAAVAPPTAGVAVGAARGAGAVEARPLERPAPAPSAAGEIGVKTTPRAVRLPYSEQNLALLSRGEPAPGAVQKPPAPPAPAPLPETQKPEGVRPEARDPEAIDFVWPARGRLLAGFSEPSNKGIDIAGKTGDAVVAAAAGRVIYTGSGIRGLGKLIVIRHDNNFQSVYAHNREILVKEGQSVTRGQKIAELGDSDAEAPKLHFEIRKSGKPVDPARYLPPG